MALTASYFPASTAKTTFPTISENHLLKKKAERPYHPFQEIALDTFSHALPKS